MDPENAAGLRVADGIGIEEPTASVPALLAPCVRTKTMKKRLLMAVGMSLALATLLIVSVHAAQSDGRWKMGPEGCYFEPNDDGPNQCTRGRWRDDGAGCYFDALDSGPDQCAPNAADNRVTVPTADPGVRTTSGQTRVAAADTVRDARAQQTHTHTPDAGSRRPPATALGALS